MKTSDEAIKMHEDAFYKNITISFDNGEIYTVNILLAAQERAFYEAAQQPEDTYWSTYYEQLHRAMENPFLLKGWIRRAGWKHIKDYAQRTVTPPEYDYDTGLKSAHILLT